MIWGSDPNLQRASLNDAEASITAAHRITALIWGAGFGVSGVLILCARMITDRLDELHQDNVNLRKSQAGRE